MTTPRNKRWNGDFATLPASYLKGVMAKMLDYGDLVQFSLVIAGPQPSYQITNAQGKKMAFDRNHHLQQVQEEEFVGVNASGVFTLAQVKAGIAGVGVASAARTAAGGARATGVKRTTAAKLHDQFAALRYEYFKNNRQTLPATITNHSDEITDLMKVGKSVEEAFDEVIKKYAK